MNAKSHTITPAVKIEKVFLCIIYLLNLLNKCCLNFKQPTIENIRPATEIFSALDLQNTDLNFTNTIELKDGNDPHTNELKVSNVIESITDKELVSKRHLKSYLQTT